MLTELNWMAAKAEIAYRNEILVRRPARLGVRSHRRNSLSRCWWPLPRRNFLLQSSAHPTSAPDPTIGPRTPTSEGSGTLVKPAA
jgi:hypothetical protein